MKKFRTLLDLFFTFAKISAFTFGGGYAMISLIDHEVVEKRHWLDEEEFMNLTVIAESTPGPIAINSATYAGYKCAGIVGSVIATLGMVIPPFVIIYLISTFFRDILQIKAVASAFKGISVAVAIVIIRAGVKMARKILAKKRIRIALPALVLCLGFAITMSGYLGGFHVSTIWLILSSGAAGFVIYAVKSFAGRKSR